MNNISEILLSGIGVVYLAHRLYRFGITILDSIRTNTKLSVDNTSFVDNDLHMIHSVSH
jgi:hypothetical protein